MGVSKVNFGNDNLIDLTSDSVTENTLLRGTTAHNAAGERITGTLDMDTDGLTWNDAEGYIGYNRCPFNPFVGTYNGITTSIVDEHKLKLNGTSTGLSWYGISEPLVGGGQGVAGTLKLKAGSYKLLFESSIDIGQKDCSIVVLSSDNTVLATTDTGTSGAITFTIDEDTDVLVGVRVAGSQVLSNLIVQAMVVKDTIDSNVDYQDYLIRNDELYDELVELDDKIDTLDSSIHTELDGLDDKIDTLDSSIHTEIDNLDTSKANETVISYVENGETSSRNYAAGAFFMRNGRLCIALQDISSGGTFTSGTNYNYTNVSSVIHGLCHSIVSSAVNMQNTAAGDHGYKTFTFDSSTYKPGYRYYIIGVYSGATSSSRGLQLTPSTRWLTGSNVTAYATYYAPEAITNTAEWYMYALGFPY